MIKTKKLLVFALFLLGLGFLAGPGIKNARAIIDTDLQISNVEIFNVTHEGFSVKWQTNMPANSFVFFSESESNLNRAAGEDVLTSSHLLSVNHLNPNTTYYVSVSSRSEARGVGNTSLTMSFKTLEATPTLTLFSPEDTSTPRDIIAGQTNVELLKVGFMANGISDIRLDMLSFRADNDKVVYFSDYFYNLRLYDENNKLIGGPLEFNANALDFTGVGVVVKQGGQRFVKVVADVREKIPAEINSLQLWLKSTNTGNVHAVTSDNMPVRNVSGDVVSEKRKVTFLAEVMRIEKFGEVISSEEISLNWKTLTSNNDCSVIYSLKDANLDDDNLSVQRDSEDYIFGSIFPSSGNNIYNLKITNRGDDVKFFQGQKAYYKIICYDGNRNKSVTPVYSFNLNSEEARFPDLTVDDIYFYPEIPTKNQVFRGEIRIKISNIGNQAVQVAPGSCEYVNSLKKESNGSITDFLGTNFLAGASIICGPTISGTNEIVYGINKVVFSGDHVTLTAHIDSRNEIVEKNENNNTLVKKIALKSATKEEVKIGDGKYSHYSNLNLNPRIILNNGLTIKPVYFRDGSKNDFINVKFEAYIDEVLIGTTEPIKDLNVYKTFNLKSDKGNYSFRAMASDLGVVYENNWFSEITFESINTATSVIKPRETEIEKITNNTNLLYENKLSEILQEINQLRNQVREQDNKIKYLQGLTGELSRVSSNIQDAINNFVTYGIDDNTKKLGEGERAAVIYSYKSAFNKLPETELELSDIVKIANGRWPGSTNLESEKRAKAEFRKIYKRIAFMDDPKDNAAVTIMAYGLRQKAENRNLESEKTGIKTFLNIYGYNPKSTEDWNIMQAITYSGASRELDSDGDFLPDWRELEIGTDPKKSDTDGDGYLDGIEVENGFNPLGRG